MTPSTVTCQAPLSMGFFKQEYLSGLPFPTLEDLPDPGIKFWPPASLALNSNSLLLSHRVSISDSRYKTLSSVKNNAKD